MKILAINIKRFVRHSVPTIVLSIAIIVMSMAILIKPSYAGESVPTRQESTNVTPGWKYGNNVYSSASEACAGYGGWVCSTSVCGTNPTYYTYPFPGYGTVFCSSQYVNSLQYDPVLNTVGICPAGSTYSYIAAKGYYMCVSTSCPANATGSPAAPAAPTTCSCNTNYIPDAGTGTYCTWNPIVADPDKNIGPCPTCGTCTGNPINAATGLKYQLEVDYLAPSGFAFKRTYNSYASSLSVSSFPLGAGGWQLDWQRSVQGSAVNGAASVVRGSGKVYAFNLVGDTWVSDADVNDELTNQSDEWGNITGWTYVTGDMDEEQYSANGQLLSVTDRAGQTTTLSYSDGTATAPNGGVIDGTTTALPAGLLIRVTDAYGRVLSLGYDAQSRIVNMTDPAGGMYSYTYDTNNNLNSVTYPDLTKKTYLYENATYSHALTGILDENNSRYATYAYDTNGRAISTQHSGGAELVALTYNTDGTTSITDALGTVRRQSFIVAQGVVKSGGMSQPGGSGCGAAASAVTYDANGNVASRIDFNGNLTTYSYNLTRNLETSRTEGLTTAGVKTTATRTILTTWDPVYRLPASITEQDTSGASPVTLRSTTFNYDASGNLTSKTITDALDPSTTRTWTYTYDTLGHVLTADGPRTDVADITQYAYDTQGNLTTVTNALSQVTTLGSYDANGRPGTLTDPNGLVTILTYDPRGRLTSRNTGGETTGYSYDSAGNLTGVTLPSGATYSYTYDAAHRLTAITDNLGNQISYTLDAIDNRIAEQIVDAANNIIQTHSRAFDALNRLYQDIGAINQITTYAYDANGNLTSTVDPLNRSTVNSYDALNRLIGSTDPASGQTNYNYTALNQLVQITDPRSLVTQYTPDGLNNLLQTVSPDTGASNATYDAASNVLTRTDAKGQVTNYTYDALNRVTSISYTGAPTQSVSFQYDQSTNGIGHLTGLTDATGATAYSYDLHGRLTGEVTQRHGATYTTGYAYDALGRLASITYPSGRAVSYTFDALGRINQIATTFNGNMQVLASNIAYQPFGGVQSFTYGDGSTQPVQTYTRQYDQDGRIASYTLSDRVMSIGYDFASQIASISDSTNLANIANYTYDLMGRLNDYTQGATSQSFNYDADGNRISQILGSTSSTYSYPPASNQLNSIQTGATTQTITQDANGATISDASRQYSYDARGRLIQTTTAQGTINYEVNALGLRVRKQVPYANTDTEYLYDSQGHLIDESATGTTQFMREYIYLGDLPVAVLQ